LKGRPQSGHDILWNVAARVIARNDSDEAIHFSACGAVDCFASLAMTNAETDVRQIGTSGKSPETCPALPAKIFRFRRRANQN